MICVYSINIKDYIYIGQTVSFYNRKKSHLSDLKNNSHHSKKLQEIFNKYPHDIYFEIEEECLVTELNDIESKYIYMAKEIYKDNCTNYMNSCGTSLHGEVSGSAKYSNDTYAKIMFLLLENIHTQEYIADYLGVSLPTVHHLASGETHGWLRDKYPSEYECLIRLNGTNRSKKYKLQRNGEFPKILNPTGEEFEVTHVTNFSKEHGLLQPKLTEVLNGTRHEHRGWRLPNCTKFAGFSIRSPFGDIIWVPNGKGAQMCEFGILPMSKHTLSKLNVGKLISYKGWTKVTDDKKFT